MFEFLSPEYNPSPSTSVGIRWDNITASQDFRTYISTINNRVRIRHTSNSVLAGITNNFNIWLWCRFTEALSPATAPILHVQHQIITTTDADPQSCLHSDEGDNTYVLKIVYIQRGLNIIPKVKELYPPDKYNAQTSMLLCSDRHHRCAVIQPDRKTTTILTNRLDFTWYHKIFSNLPAIFSDFQVLLTEQNPAAHGIFKALYNKDTATLEQLILQDLAQWEIEKATRTFSDFIEKANQQNNEKQTKLTNQIKNTEQELESTLNLVAHLSAQRDTLNCQLTGLQLNPSTLPAEQINFIMNCKSIQITEIDNTGVWWCVTTPITNYRLQDVEMYYKHKSPNLLNRPEWFAKLIRLIFIEEKYQLITTTHIKMPWTGDTSKWKNTTNNYDQFGNPHIVRFNCFSSSKAKMCQPIKDQDYITACSILINACATVTFTDSSAITELVGKMCNKHFTTPIIKDVATGQMYSPENMKTILTAKPTPAPTETPTET